MELQTIIVKDKRIDIFLPVIHHETNYFKIKMFPKNIRHIKQPNFLWWSAYQINIMNVFSKFYKQKHFGL